MRGVYELLDAKPVDHFGKRRHILFRACITQQVMRIDQCGGNVAQDMVGVRFGTVCSV